jgi:hypothetical protein
MPSKCKIIKDGKWCRLAKDGEIGSQEGYKCDFCNSCNTAYKIWHVENHQSQCIHNPINMKCATCRYCSFKVEDILYKGDVVDDKEYYCKYPGKKEKTKNYLSCEYYDKKEL